LLSFHVLKTAAAFVMLGNGDCAGAPDCNNKPDCSQGLQSLHPPCHDPNEGAQRGGGEIWTMTCQLVPRNPKLNTKIPTTKPTLTLRILQIYPPCAGCSVLLPPAERATYSGVPPGAFVADIKCTADTAMYLAPHCSARRSRAGALVTKKCLVGPLPADGSAPVDPATGERVPLVTDDDCVATGYFTNHNRTVALKSAVFTTADGAPCDVEALGDPNAEPCYLQVGRGTAIVHF
jgi:hypothetical protein